MYIEDISPICLSLTWDLLCSFKTWILTFFQYTVHFLAILELRHVKSTTISYTEVTLGRWFRIKTGKIFEVSVLIKLYLISLLCQLSIVVPKRFSVFSLTFDNTLYKAFVLLLIIFMVSIFFFFLCVWVRRGANTFGQRYT